jgi:hypothetical protein
MSGGGHRRQEFSKKVAFPFKSLDSQPLNSPVFRAFSTRIARLGGATRGIFSAPAGPKGGWSEMVLALQRKGKKAGFAIKRQAQELKAIPANSAPLR